MPNADIRQTGSDTTTERCFRLLRWISNRPEHPAPPTVDPSDRPQGTHQANSIGSVRR